MLLEEDVEFLRQDAMELYCPLVCVVCLPLRAVGLRELGLNSAVCGRAAQPSSTPQISQVWSCQWRVVLAHSTQVRSESAMRPREVVVAWGFKWFNAVLCSVGRTHSSQK